MRQEAWQALEETYMNGDALSIGTVNYHEDHLLMLFDNAI